MLLADGSYRPTVAVLCARSKTSPYLGMPGVEVYTPERDSWTFPGGVPVVAHPPCRAWGNIRWRAKPTEFERNLTALCANWVRACGGVLEHPRGSLLFKAMDIHPDNPVDQWGGYCLDVKQYWWGHEAEKATWLYVCGVPREKLPTIPFKDGQPPKVVQAVLGLRKGMPGWRPEISKAARELTPPPLAEWLVNLARLVHL